MSVETKKLSPEAAEMLKQSIDLQVESAKKSYGINQLAQMWLAGEDLPDSTSSKPTKPYKQVALVFTCVNKLIRSIAGLPLVLSTINEKIIESGPAYDLLFNNPSKTWQQFITQTIGHFVLSSDVFWAFTEMQGQKPKEIMVVSGTQMHPITHNRRASGELIGWEFRGANGERANFTLDEVYQWKNFNPYDKFHGLGPVQACQLNINYGYAADLYNSSALANGAEPGAILTMPGSPDEDQIRMQRSQFDARHKGAGKAKRTILLTGGMDIKTIAMKMTDMQVAKITEMSDKKICSTFGVPPGVAGLVTDAQYSHGPAMQDFIFNTVVPLAALFGDEITSGILSRFSGSKMLGNDFPATEVKDAKFYSGCRTRALSKNVYYRNARHKAASVQTKVFAWFDASQHPVVQEYQRETSEKVLKFTEAGIPVNQLIEAHDLPYERFDWGDDWWIGMGQVPARFTLEAGLEGLTGPPLPEGGEEEGKSMPAKLAEQIVKSAGGPEKETIKADERERLRIWRRWVVSWAGIEREYSVAVRKFFLRQQRILLGKLKEAINEGKSTKDDFNIEQIITRVVFDLKLENSKIKVIHHTFFAKASELGIRQGLTETSDLSGEQLDELVEEVKRRPVMKSKLTISTHKITGVNKTTQNIVASQLRQGLDAGEGLSQLAERIRSVTGKSLGRAQSIARTQTAGAVGTGRHEGLKTSGVPKKAWLDSGDKDVRPAHRTAGMTYASGIPIDQPFVVDGEILMYPADPSGSAANIINCRCVELAIAADGKSPDYVKVKFYSYQDMQKAQTKREDNKNEN